MSLVTLIDTTCRKAGAGATALKVPTNSVKVIPLTFKTSKTTFYNDQPRNSFFAFRMEGQEVLNVLVGGTFVSFSFLLGGRLSISWDN